MMAVELSPEDYAYARPLFAELEHHLSIAAVLDGSMPGRVFADSASSPQVALISSPEGSYLASAGPPAEATLAFGQTIVARLLAEWQELSLFAPPAWEREADALFAGARYGLAPRRRYGLRALAGPWHQHVPAGLELLRLDAAIFARPALQEHHIQRWARGNWGSVEAFLARGFGFIIFHGEQAASWCLADSASEARCEIGIHTHPDYRRQGLATIVVAATVAHALAHGLSEVGWHCGEENRGSQAVAEKAGFRLTHRFNALFCPPEAAA
jgi:GNAT superfamily N-acetyltransferase